MKKTNKILIGLLLISSLFLGIGYAAIENITLDIGGNATAIPTTRILVTGENFNKILKGSTSTEASDTTITKIVFDYWKNGYSDNGTQVLSNEDWDNGTAIDSDGLGVVRLFKTSDGTKAYILSEAPIYGNTNCKLMFSYFEAVTEIIFNNFDESKVNRMNYMFQYCRALNKLDLSNFTVKVNAMEYMFLNCSSLTELDLSGFNTSNVTTMERVFGECNSLKELDISSFDTSKVTNMKRMFWNCNALPELDLSNFNTSKVQNMEYMFFGCKNLTKLNIASFRTSNVTSMVAMFGYCSSLIKLDLSNFDTSKIESMYNLFGYCSSLTELKISNFNTSNVTDMRRMFDKCNVLTELDLSSFDTSKVTNMLTMFRGNFKLRKIYVSDKWSIENVDHSSIPDNEYQPFLSCTSIVGGAGTTYNSSYVDKTYARIDGGPNSDTPGYLTLKTSP